MLSLPDSVAGARNDQVVFKAEDSLSVVVFGLGELEVWVDRQEGFCFPYKAKLLASLVFEPVNPGFYDWKIGDYLKDVFYLDAPKGVSSPGWGGRVIDFVSQELDEGYLFLDAIFNILRGFCVV